MSMRMLYGGPPRRMGSREDPVEKIVKESFANEEEDIVRATREKLQARVQVLKLHLAGVPNLQRELAQIELVLKAYDQFDADAKKSSAKPK